MFSKRCRASKFCGQLPSPKADAALPAEFDVAVDGEDDNTAETIRYQAVLRAPIDGIGPEAKQQFACAEKLTSARKGEENSRSRTPLNSCLWLNAMIWTILVTAIKAHA